MATKTASRFTVKTFRRFFPSLGNRSSGRTKTLLPTSSLYASPADPDRLQCPSHLFRDPLGRRGLPRTRAVRNTVLGRPPTASSAISPANVLLASDEPSAILLYLILSVWSYVASPRRHPARLLRGRNEITPKKEKQRHATQKWRPEHRRAGHMRKPKQERRKNPTGSTFNLSTSKN